MLSLIPAQSQWKINFLLNCFPKSRMSYSTTHLQGKAGEANFQHAGEPGSVFHRGPKTLRESASNTPQKDAHGGCSVALRMQVDRENRHYKSHP